MSNQKKNLAVGITVLMGLGLLGYMIVKFGDAPAKLFAKPQFSIFMVGERADGLSDGSAVRYKGITVGRVQRVGLAEDNEGVKVTVMIDEDSRVPGNVEAQIRTTVIGGSSAVELEIPRVPTVAAGGGETPPATVPARGTISTSRPAPRGFLKPGDTIRMQFAGTGLVPPEITDLATELRHLSRDIRETKLLEHLDQTILSARRQIDKMGATLDSVQQFVGDERMRGDIRATVANLRAASENAKAIAGNMEKLTANANTQLTEVSGDARKLMATGQGRLDDLSRQANDRLLQVAKILENVEQVTRKMNEGEGTVARLVNDPKLYNTIYDTSRELNLAMGELKRLVEQWQQEGLYFKLSK